MPAASHACMLRHALIVAALGLAVAGCDTPLPERRSNPLYAPLSSPSARIDVAAAASLLNDYRKSVGLGPVSIDPALQAFAERQVGQVAGASSLAIPGNRSLAQRLGEAGLAAQTAKENVSAGYYTLSDAFSGWRGSPPNDATLRLAGARRMGIATRAVPGSKYAVYWVLVMAGP